MQGALIVRASLELGCFLAGIAISAQGNSIVEQVHTRVHTHTHTHTHTHAHTHTRTHKHTHTHTTTILLFIRSRSSLNLFAKSLEHSSLLQSVCHCIWRLPLPISVSLLLTSSRFSHLPNVLALRIFHNIHSHLCHHHIQGTCTCSRDLLPLTVACLHFSSTHSTYALTAVCWNSHFGLLFQILQQVHFTGSSFHGSSQ